MELYLLRHGIAEEKNLKEYSDDSQRPLTDEGRKKMKDIAKAMRKMELAFDLILSSPYVRAKQTAEIVVKEFKAEKIFKLTDNLAVGAPSYKILRELNQKYSSCYQILLVGHEPFLGQLISVLLSGRPGIGIEMKKGGLCKLSCQFPLDEHLAILNWLVSPGITRSIA